MHVLCRGLGNDGPELVQNQTCLCLGVVRSHEVWGVFLLEALATTLRKVFVVMENAASRIRCQVNATLVTQVGQIQHAQHVNPNHIQLQHQTRKVNDWSQTSLCKPNKKTNQSITL